MKIVVIGCGKIGSTVIASLVAEGHDVTAIDRDAARLSEVVNVQDVIGVCGNGADYDTLMEADIGKADMVVAATDSDEVNMLTCFMAGRMGAKNTIARIRQPEYNDRNLHFMKEQLGLSMVINPEQLAAQALFHILQLPSAAKVETFSRRNFEMIELQIRENSMLVDIPLSKLREKYKAKFLVCVVRRGNDVFVPDGSFVIKAGDRIGMTAQPTEIHKLLQSIHMSKKQVRDVMLLGGSRTAFYLAKQLLASGTGVKILEIDRTLCEDLCAELPGAMILSGDGTSREMLLEEGLRDMDAFVALTGMDEQNILMSIFAASQNVPKVIAKINRERMDNMARQLGLECIVSPRKIIADVLVRYARALQNSLGSNVETLYSLMDGNAEAVEFNVRDDSRLVQKPLKELVLKPQTLIAGILRGRESIIPTGDDVIKPGDKVVVVAAGRKLRDLSEILK